MLEVSPLVPSLFCLTKRFLNGFFDFEASNPPKVNVTFGEGVVKSLRLEGFEPGLSEKQ